MKYTENQKKAINHFKGPCLVLAVPGSGKTTVLLERISTLLSIGINPENILAMTFSKSQALDMEQRYKKSYGGKISFSTIHSFAYSIIRKKYLSLGKDINLIEGSNQYNKYSVISRFYSEINHNKITEEEVENFFAISSFIKNSLMSYNDYIKKYGKTFKGFEKVYNSYEKFKMNKNLIDFDDMLILALKILKNDKSILIDIQNRFKYIQVDEGQDSSIAQLEIIYLISKPENNLFIVADDDQSIYGFRGANSAELLNFKSIFPDAKIYYMEENFRSSKNIVRLANSVIKNNKQRYDKGIKHTRDIKNNIVILKAKNTLQQTKHVVKKAIECDRAGKSVAILYRNNISGLPIIKELSNYKFYIKDLKLDFFNNIIIRDLIDIKNFSVDQFDLSSFERIYYKLNLYLKKSFISEIADMSSDMSVIDRLYQCSGVNSFFREKIDLLSYYMDKLANMNFKKSVMYIMTSIGYYEYLVEFSRRKNISLQSINRTIDCLLSLLDNESTIKDFENLKKSFIDIYTCNRTPGPNINLSTIHGAKGLEFDSVFLIDLVNDEFPSSHSLNSDKDESLLEEERRLFYVGITRAKDYLELIYPKKINSKKVKPSIFLQELTKNRIR